MDLEIEEKPLKLYFIPYLAPGHMIPLCDIAIQFAARRHHVTIITTPFNAQILTKSLSFNQNLRLHTVSFPSQEVGLPDGVENLSAATNLDNLTKIYHATTLLRPPIQHFVEQHPPDCIVADFLFPWVDELANKLRITRLAFNGFSLFAICAIESVKANSHYDSASFLIHDLPHPISMNAAPPKKMHELLVTLFETVFKSNGIVVNNFVELDGEEYIKHYEKTTGHKAWHLGPASLIRKTDQEKAERGEESVVSVHECLSWLNSKRVNSVIYIGFGSLCHFPDKQLYEIACGIEASGYEFVWVVPEKKGKEYESEEEKEKWLPKGFEERNSEKGLIVRGWAPQVLILSHPAVGAFMTHCGWNSIVEAVSAGIPMITWPVHGEQFYNEKLITQVRGIGVEVGAGEWSNSGYGEREKLVSGESIEKALRRLMDGGDDAQEIRRRAREFGDKAKEAAQEGGSSYKNLTVLIDDLKRLRDCNLQASKC
ncbi:UDP-glucose flavonoid 3-O-glucosyltransferase 7 [Cicer arietinum]|uniref:Glycosyltransferase n=1 Tax=Cicer arietinum TaxID=3827 RepID=A0A067XTW1_CICAR|nr:UDP-glucose flavonoid 3-O-glucosyltransferase 7 [Cicer arietinum]XP_027192526.1 UDP-glucose flavonoid 3-O-glucosyltransferase 7 [Cicer arietinum]XP_027192527.1 UDP-glucose flavonoid 3-O-glucosyltransferase 7 [Cicer arietinum]AGU14072.1 UDP-glycosyltransferase [Cicer arietinum]